MSTVIRPELSKKHEYWIDKHRYYELKHFCLQYHIWKKACAEIGVLNGRPIHLVPSRSNSPNDPTSKYVDMRSVYFERMRMIENAAYETDPILSSYVFKAVTEGLSYTTLKTKFGLPCGKDKYYSHYRKFFWILNKARV